MALYGDLIAARFGDLDILIHEYDIERAVQFCSPWATRLSGRDRWPKQTLPITLLWRQRMAAEAFWAYQVVPYIPSAGIGRIALAREPPATCCPVRRRVCGRILNR